MRDDVIPEGFRMTEIGLVPMEWNITNLGHIVDIQDRRRIPLSSSQRSNMQGVYPYCGANGIIDHIDDYIFDGEYILLAEDGGFWDKYQNTAYLMNGKFWVNNHAHIVSAKDGSAINRFILYWLNYADIESYTSGTTRKKLNQGVMKSIPIPLPPLPEQKKIAAVLSTVQEAKEKTEVVIEAARELKKSLMKYLFTYGPVSVDDAESVPLRETEVGPIPESWGVKAIGEVCNIIVPGRDKPKRFDGNIPWITMPDVRNRIYVEKSISDLGLSRDAIDEVRGKVIPTHSIIMSCIGEFGITAIAGCPMVINQQLHAFTCPDDLDPYFVSHAITMRKSYMERIAHFTTIAYLNKGKCESIPIPLTPLPIQHKIADILSAVDRKIEAEEGKKKALEELFKTLLNNLMTGKIRVNNLDMEP